MRKDVAKPDDREFLAFNVLMSLTLWFTALKDKLGRARIVHRIWSAEFGNFGDCEPVGEEVTS